MLEKSAINPNQTVSFEAANLTKSFDRKTIFDDVSFSLGNGDALAITGRNGSGKSTLVKILSNTLSSSSGAVGLQVSDSIIKNEDFYKYIGVVSPYIYFYEEFTAYETLLLTSRIRGIGNDRIDEILERVGLYQRKNDSVRIFSSGMKQRLKFAFAVLHQPVVLMLDEPTSNLDREGIKTAEDILGAYRERGILVVATNSEYEKSFCKKEINLD